MLDCSETGRGVGESMITVNFLLNWMNPLLHMDLVGMW